MEVGGHFPGGGQPVVLPVKLMEVFQRLLLGVSEPGGTLLHLGVPHGAVGVADGQGEAGAGKLGAPTGGDADAVDGMVIRRIGHGHIPVAVVAELDAQLAGVMVPIIGQEAQHVAILGRGRGGVRHGGKWQG